MSQTVEQTITLRSGPGEVAVNTPGGMAETHDRILTRDEQEALVSEETVPGQIAYVKLSETGEPTGPAEPKKIPGEAQAPVVKLVPPDDSVVTTPSGAPITDHMNPTVDHYDAGLAARNPIEGVPVRTAEVQSPGAPINEESPPPPL